MLHTAKPEYKLVPLCKLFGVSRQAFYQRKDFDFESGQFKCCILEYVREIRKEAPRSGCQKLYVMCRNFFGEDFRLGRDAFYHLLHDSGLMIRIRHRHTRTTNSFHNYRLYPNLIRGYIPTTPNQLWVSDITYIPLSVRFCFLSLVTDAYTHEIIGWVLAPTLEYKYTQQALQNAINYADADLNGLIHHSDRGVQYAYDLYINLLTSNGIKISMTENGDPLENAIAERVNGILKQEWLNQYSFQTINDVRPVVEKIIEYYNTQRPHASINMMTPREARQKSGALKKHWKNKYPKKLELAELNANFVYDNRTMGNVVPL
jgi:putative transposase